MPAAMPFDTLSLAAIARAVSRAVEREIDRTTAVAEIVNAIAVARLESMPAERGAQESAAMLDAYDRAGANRDAAAKVARRFAVDPLDPAELERISRRVRRLVHLRKTDPVRFAASRVGMILA